MWVDARVLNKKEEIQMKVWECQDEDVWYVTRWNSYEYINKSLGITADVVGKMRRKFDMLRNNDGIVRWKIGEIREKGNWDIRVG